LRKAGESEAGMVTNLEKEYGEQRGHSNGHEDPKNKLPILLRGKIDSDGWMAVFFECSARRNLLDRGGL
jgi:hypothetical protein